MVQLLLLGTQAVPKVEIFGLTPNGSEPTGITFSPDNRFLFMSIQHPSSSNNAAQIDAAGNIANFNVATTLVIALNENLGDTLSNTTANLEENLVIYPNPSEGLFNLNLKRAFSNIKVSVHNLFGQSILDKELNSTDTISLDLSDKPTGVYFVKIESNNTLLDIVKLVKK